MPATVENPWHSLPTSPPYVLADDLPIVEAHNARRDSKHQFRLDTLPEPYMGPLDAPVVLLNLNPGFDPTDLTSYAPAARASMMRRSLTHDLPPEDAFYFLTDEFRGTGGWTWWEQKLRPLIEAVGLEQTRHAIQVIEHIPYKSEKFYAPRHILPSQSYTFDLARRAVARGAEIVVMRRRKQWLSSVPELADAGFHELNSPMAARISPKNCPTGFDRLVDRARDLGS